MAARRQPTRFTPRGPAQAFQTYGVRTVPNRKGRRATCAEIGCAPHLHGWRTVLDPADPQTGARVHFIRTDRTRRHVEGRDEAGRFVFEFEAGQTCFSATDDQHWTEHDALYLIRGGDWRGDPTGRPARTYDRPDQWVDDFASHQDRLATRRARG